MLPPPSQPQLQPQRPCLSASVLLSQPWWWEAGKPLQPQCSVLAWTWAMASSSLGFLLARHRLGVLWVTRRSLLVCVVDGIGPKGLSGHLLFISFSSAAPTSTVSGQLWRSWRRTPGSPRR